MDKVNGQRVSAVLIMTNKEKSLLTVNVSVEPFSEVGKEVRITSKDIQHLLSEKEMLVCKCIQSSVISNMSDNSLFGTWVFELPVPDVIPQEVIDPIIQEITAIEDERILERVSEQVSEENSSQDDFKPKRGRRRIVKKEE